MGIDKKNNSGKHSQGNNTTPRSKNNKVDIDKEIEYMDNYVKNVKTTDEKRKKKMSRPLKIFLIILTALIVTAAAIFGRYLFKSGGSVTEAFKSMVKDVVGDQDPIFVLVLGVSEDISVELTDTIMLIGYNPDNNQAFVLSIPRDTFIGESEARAGGFDKINALYQKDPQRTVKAVENLTGIKIDHYVTVKTSVLVKIVDTIGGVDFDVPIDMDYDDDSQDLHIHLKAGPQKIDGDKAEQLVRFRHNNNGSTYSPQYGDNDEGRMRTQREFLKVVASNVIKTRSIEQIKQITSALFDNLVTDITVDKILGYIPYAMDINIDEIEMAQLPGGFAKMNSLWFYKADSTKTEQLVQGYVDKLGLSESEKSKYVIGKPKKSTTETKKENTSNSSTSKTKTNNVEESTKKTEKSSINTTSKNTSMSNTTKSSNNVDSTSKQKNTDSTTSTEENTSNKSNTENSTSTTNSSTGNSSKTDSQTNKNSDSGSNNSSSSESTSSQSSTSESSQSNSNGNSGSTSSGGSSGEPSGDE